MRSQAKHTFVQALKEFTQTLNQQISTKDGQWTIKGFIDVYKNVYTISSDTKIVSKILEIHLFPLILHFAEENGYMVVPAEKQNYYPDLSFVSKSNPERKFAVDIKTTFRLPNRPDYCNGFTLGSHGEYFTNRQSTKNIQFPYDSYSGHFCLGIIYDRVAGKEHYESNIYQIDELQSLTSVVTNFQFFAEEKWKIASDKGGSGNTANIGSINYIPDILNGNGMFSKLGEEWFDEYWMNFNSITIRDEKGKTKKIRSIKDFVAYRGGDASLIVPRPRLTGKKKQ